jgi:HAD superfamily hydrolase (TIGR01509 family)
MVFPIPNLEAILFDMDGLMLDSESLYQQAWKQAAAELGYDLDDAVYLSLVGRSNAEAERAFVQLYGTDFPVETFRVRWEQRWQALVQIVGIPLNPGLLELLNWIETHGLLKAVGTSSNQAEATLCLQTAGIADRFAAIVTVDQVAAGKPAPDIFQAAAQRLTVNPSHCLVLEDSNAGVQAAQGAGMAVVMVPDLQTATIASEAIALQIFESLHEVRLWLSREV